MYAAQRLLQRNQPHNPSPTPDTRAPPLPPSSAQHPPIKPPPNKSTRDTTTTAAPRSLPADHAAGQLAGTLHVAPHPPVAENAPARALALALGTRTADSMHSTRSVEGVGRRTARIILRAMRDQCMQGMHHCSHRRLEILTISVMRTAGIMEDRARALRRATEKLQCMRSMHSMVLTDLRLKLLLDGINV